MREIKFRAWDLIAGTMRHVASIEFDAAGELSNVLLLGQPLKAKNAYNTRFESRTDGEDLQLMQFTGRKDENRKEIYEGDIVKYFEEDFRDKNSPLIEFYVVDYDQEEARFYLRSLEDKEYNADFSISPIEVIGNIYENPELVSTDRTQMGI